MELTVGKSRYPRKWLVPSQTKLFFFGVQSKPIWWHPNFHDVDDINRPGSQISGIRRLTWAMELGIISVQMYAKPKRYGYVEDVEKRAEHWALGHCRTHNCTTRDRSTVVNCLHATNDEWPHPIERRSREPKRDGIKNSQAIYSKYLKLVINYIKLWQGTTKIINVRKKVSE